MANFNFWEFGTEQEVNDLRALDFERQAKESINKADADLWSRDAGQLLGNSRQQFGDMIGNTLNSVRSTVAEPVEQAVQTTQRAVQSGQQAADDFSQWAGGKLSEVRSKLPGYDQPVPEPTPQSAPSTPPARDDWKMPEQASETAKSPSVSPEGSGSALLDALNDHTAPAKVTAQPDSAPPKPADKPFPADTTVPRDDWRKEWRPQLYQETPNAVPPWSGQDRGPVNPELAPLDDALRKVQRLFSGSPSNPNPGQSQYNGLYTNADQYGGNAVSASPHQIGVNARDHLVGVMRDYWQANGKEPDSDQGLSAIARTLTETMAHEVAHDSDPEHSPRQAAITKQISQADGSAGYQTIYNALKQMRESGDLTRVVDTAKAGTSPNPNEVATRGAPAVGMSPSERGGSPLLDALNDHQGQDNPDQPSGLSGTPKESVVPTFAPQSIDDPAPEPMSDREKAAREPGSGGIGGAVLSGLGAQDAVDRFNQQGEQSGRTKLWNDFLGTIGVIHDESVQKAAQAFADAQARGEPTDGVFDRLKLAVRSGVMQDAAGRALQPAEQLAVQLMADSEEATAQAADAALKMFGLDREGKAGVPNPLASGKIGGVTVPGLRSVGEFAGVDPNARLGAGEVVHVADAFKPLQAVAQGGQFVEHPLETAATVAGFHYGGKAIGAAGGAAARAIGSLRPVQRAGAAIGNAVGTLRDAATSMTRGLPGGAPAMGAVESDRYYHGTGGAFDRPNPATFDENGLFGPGYYLTSDPRVAGGVVHPDGTPAIEGYATKGAAPPAFIEKYATQLADIERQLADPNVADRQYLQMRAKALQEQLDAFPNSSPNVRAVDVPRGLRIFNVDAPLSIPDKNAVAKGLSAYEGSSRLTETARNFLRDLSHYDANPRPADNAHAWLLDHFDGDNAAVNGLLKTAGFDGIAYSGGKRIPMQDEAGQDITHQAVMIFPSSLDKITNATSGLPGGLLPAAGDVAESAGQAVGRYGQQAVGGALAGGYSASQEPDATPGSVLGGAALGAVGGVVRGAIGRRGTGQALARVVASYGPGTDAIDRSITPTPQPGPLAQPGEIPTEVVRQLFDNAVGLREIGDRLGHPLNIGDDAYKLLRLARGSSAAADDRIETELGPALENLGKQGVGDLNRLLKSMDIVDKAASTGNPLRNFGGATLADAHTAMAELQTRLGQQGYTELEQRAQKVWDFGDQLRDRLVQAGVWSAQTAADLKAKHPHYSPIRVADWLEDKAGGKGTGAGDTISNSANLLKSLTEEGTARASETPLDAYVRLAHEVERVAMKNEAGRAFVNYFHQDPALASLVRPADRQSAAFLGTGAQVADHRAPGESGFHVRVNGQELTYWMDQSLERAFNFTAPSLNHWALNLAFGLPARVLRAGATGVNVLFMLPNAMGDGFTYMVRNGGDLPKSLGNMAKGYAGAITRDADYHAMMRAGGGQAGFWDRKVGGGKQTIESMAGALSTPRQVFNWVRDVIPNVGQTVETATRLGQFKRDISEGIEPRQAALNARDVTVDFARGGELTKTLNSFIPFFNVGFQAPAQVARMLQNPQTRGRALVGLGGMVIAPAILSEVYNQKDPTYADVPQTYKDRGLILMDPRGPGPVDPETGRPTPRFVQINSREWTPFVIAVRESVARAMGKDVRPWQEAAQALLKSSSPVEPGANALFDLMPPAAKVGVEAIANYDSFRDRPIVPDSLKRLPAPQQFNAQTSETAKKLGALTGQSPLQIEHAVTGLAAGVGRQALAAGDMVLKAAGQTPEPSRRIAQIQLDLSKTGLDPEKRAILEHELAAEQSKVVARGSLVRAQPVIGGLASTIYREQGGALTDQATKATDQRLEAAKRGQTPATAEMKRLGVSLSDVSPDIGGQRLNRLQEQQYRAQALSLRERLLGDLVSQPTYQKADDASKTRMLQAASSRASAWAGQAIVKRPDAEGYEFTTARVGQDPAKAVDGYLKAVALNEQLRQLATTKYLGVKGPAAEQFAGDVRELGAFRQALGKSRGDMEFVRSRGAARFARADGAEVDPRYTLLRERVEKDPIYQLYFGSRAVLDLAR